MSPDGERRENRRPACSGVDSPRQEWPERRTRAISTVLDAALFLVLVSAAIGLLYAAPTSGGSVGDDASHDLAAAAASTAATSVHTIEYVPGADGESGTHRVDRGTLAELLAETTVANADLRGANLTRTPNHTAEVRASAAATTDRFGSDLDLQLRTRWRPLPGSGIRGGIVVGPPPPADVDVHVATLSVPLGSASAIGPTTVNWTGAVTAANESGIASGRTNRTGAANHSTDVIDRTGVRTAGLPLETVATDYGCRGVASAAARRIVGQLFPPERTRTALLTREAPEATARERYERAIDAVGIDGAAIPDSPTAREYNGLLATALTDRLRPTVCEGYESPAAAAERANPRTVTVVVRAWSP